MERFPAKAVTICSVLSAAYQLAIWMGLPPSDGIAQWEANRIRMERFDDGSGSVSLLLAGSSMSANIPISKVVPGALNLGVEGGGVRTSVASIFARSGRPISVIVIEMNELIIKNQDTQLDSLNFCSANDVASPEAFYVQDRIQTP